MVGADLHGTGFGFPGAPALQAAGQLRQGHAQVPDTLGVGVAGFAHQ